LLALHTNSENFKAIDYGFCEWVENEVAKMRFLSLVGTAFLRNWSNTISKTFLVMAGLCFEKMLRKNEILLTKI
jgi:hypothetical protein